MNRQPKLYQHFRSQFPETKWDFLDYDDVILGNEFYFSNHTLSDSKSLLRVSSSKWIGKKVSLIFGNKIDRMEYGVMRKKKEIKTYTPGM